MSDDYRSDPAFLIRIRELEGTLRRQENEVRRLTAQLKSREKRNKRIMRANAALKAQLDEILRLPSWRATAPLRRVLGERLKAPAPEGVAPERERTTPPGEDLALATTAPARGPLFGIGRDGLLLAQKFEMKLWGGFSTVALADLERLKLSPLSSPDETAYAAWALGRWHFAGGDMALAYDNAILSRAALARAESVIQWLPRAVLFLEAECLIALGRREVARAMLERAIAEKPDISTRLIMANAHLAAPGEPAGREREDAQRLAWINTALARGPFEPIRLRDPEAPLTIDNLTAAAPVLTASATPLVSVIMPAYNAAATIGYAIRGVLEQTWPALELIIVDDRSPDETLAIARRAAEADSRIKVVGLAENVGANQARNAALPHCAGEYITVHDADDWSHPQKIELQVAEIAGRDGTAGSISYWTRVDHDLRFVWGYRPQPTLIDANASSFLFHRTLLDRLGGWLPDRDSGDTEFINRAQRVGEIVMVRRGAPLSFGLLRVDSLTRGEGGNDIRTIHYGSRREYREAAEHWHATLPPEGYFADPAVGRIPFPVPPSLFAAGQETDFDVLFVMDFNLGGGAYHSTMNYVLAAIRSGLKVGVFQWRRYDLDVLARLDTAVRDLALKGLLRVVTPGERIRARHVLVGYPSILNYMIDRFPEVSFDHLIIIVNQMAERLATREEFEYDPVKVRDNLRTIFGSEGHWAPISDHVRRLMLADGRYPVPLADTWTPLIDVESAAARPLAWRGRERERFVVGRHGRDHPNKWPSERQALLDAYCAGRACDVAILGGADNAVRILGAQPENWTVAPYGSADAAAFLATLDFYIHYPHEAYIEEFGRATIEAMAAGLPVVLPAYFEETFGDAAVYARPGEVFDTLSRHWADEALYLAQAARGRAFVRRHCGWDQLARRLARIERPAAA